MSAPSKTDSDSFPCYVVYESALLLLFTVCRFCRRETVLIKKDITGSFLHSRMKCSRCLKEWTWESQPSFGNVRAGNICVSCYFTRRCIASQSSQDVCNLELLHHYLKDLFPPPKSVPSTDHILHTEKPTIGFVVQFKRVLEEVITSWRWLS